MAGFHVRYRKTNKGIYNAVEGELQLPSKLKADIKKDTNTGEFQNICPEFFFGMYKDVYGFDAGIIYSPNDEFKLVINLLSNTSYKNRTWFETKLTNLKPSDRVYLEVFLIPDTVFVIARNPNNRKDVYGKLNAMLNENAFNAINEGAFINREIALASNLSDNKYSPSNAFFSDTTWRKTKITNAMTHEVIHLTEQNSRLIEPFDDHEKYKNGIRPKSFLYGGYTVTEPGYDGLGDFVADVGSADCR